MPVKFIIEAGQKGPVIKNLGPKLAVPDRRSWDIFVRETKGKPFGHEVEIVRMVHDTKPDNDRRGVRFYEIRHAADCEHCRRLKVAETLREFGVSERDINTYIRLGPKVMVDWVQAVDEGRLDEAKRLHAEHIRKQEELKRLNEERDMLNRALEALREAFDNYVYFRRSYTKLMLKRRFGEKIDLGTVGDRDVVLEVDGDIDLYKGWIHIYQLRNSSASTNDHSNWWGMEDSWIGGVDSGKETIATVYGPDDLKKVPSELLEKHKDLLEEMANAAGYYNCRFGIREKVLARRRKAFREKLSDDERDLLNFGIGLQFDGFPVKEEMEVARNLIQRVAAAGDIRTFLGA